MTGTFGGSTVLLTGAASGIGKSLAALLLKCGATVHAFDMNAEGLGTLAAQGTGTLHTYRVNVADLADYSSAVGKVLETSPAIDFLFNNAGVTLLGEAQNLPFDRWKWLLDINLMGVINGTQLVYPHMIARGGGHIVNTASIAGGTGYATAAAYTTSKAAVLEFSRSLRAEAKSHGIRVSVVCPGYVNSGIFTQERIVGADRDAMIRDLPVKMMSTDEAAWGFLTGISKRKDLVIFPFTAQFLWYLSCWFPAMISPFHKRFLRSFQRK